MKVQHTARLHERTVQEVAKGKKVTRKQGRSTSRKNGKVVTNTVRRDVWQAARAIKEGEGGYTRIERIGPDEVIVK